MSQSDALQRLNRVRLATLAGQQAAARWCKSLEGDFSAILMHLDAALASLSSEKPAIPEGWKLVPVEPTEAMVEAGVKDSKHYILHVEARDIYRIMLAAAPSQSVGDSEQGGAK